MLIDKDEDKITSVLNPVTAYFSCQIAKWIVHTSNTRLIILYTY